MSNTPRPAPHIPPQPDGLAHKLVDDLEQVAAIAICAGFTWVAAHPIDGIHLLDGHAWWALLTAAAGAAVRAGAHALKLLLP